MGLLAADFLEHTGSVVGMEAQGDGCNYEVAIITAERGRFVWKRGATPVLVAELEAEFAVLGQLGEARPFVPSPVARVDNEFLFTCVEGVNMVEALRRAGAAAELRHVHGWRPGGAAGVDRSAGLDAALRRARHNVESGALTRPLSQAGPFLGADPRSLLAALEQWRPGVISDTVFGHGDYCLPNVLALDWTASGVIDWSRGGWTDRRVDLAAGVWTIRHNLGGGAYCDTFLTAYGYAESADSLTQFEALWLLT